MIYSGPDFPCGFNDANQKSELPLFSVQNRKPEIMSSHLESPRENVVLAQKEMDHGAKGDSNKKLHVEQKKIRHNDIFVFPRSYAISSKLENPCTK